MTNNKYNSKDSALLQKICRQLIALPAPLSLDALESFCSEMDINGHLAILNGDYIEKILSRRKTVESRFSKNRIPPFHKVSTGDVLFLKQSAGKLLAIAIVSRTEFFDSLDHDKIDQLMNKYQEKLQLDDDFKRNKRNCNYASLLHLSDVIATPAISIKKQDRRSWIIIKAD